jgi:hypothetical protein
MYIEKLKALALAATPQDFDSAQIKREGGWADCPTCGGDGTVSLGKDYCNYDGAALGVQFYGIGDEHVKAEAYYRAANPATVLELIAEVEQLRADAERYRLMRAQLSSGDLDYYRLEGEPQNGIDAYCDGEIEAHTKAGKEEA